MDYFASKYSMELFRQTSDGKLKITYYPTNGEPPFQLTHNVEWDIKAAKNMAIRCLVLVRYLTHIGEVYDELNSSEEKVKELLDYEEQMTWDTFVKPFGPFEVEYEVIDELLFRGEFDELSDEEDELLERYYDWLEEKCSKRLPNAKNSPVNFIRSAQDYVYFVRIKAPEEDIKKAAMRLVEERVLYLHKISKQ